MAFHVQTVTETSPGEYMGTNRSSLHKKKEQPSLENSDQTGKSKPKPQHARRLAYSNTWRLQAAKLKAKVSTDKERLSDADYLDVFVAPNSMADKQPARMSDRPVRPLTTQEAEEAETVAKKNEMLQVLIQKRAVRKQHDMAQKKAAMVSGLATQNTNTSENHGPTKDVQPRNAHSDAVKSKGGPKSSGNVPDVEGAKKVCNVAQKCAEEDWEIVEAEVAK